MSAGTLTEKAVGYELKITRTFDAPRELVWRAWTEPAMAKKWMGPRGFHAAEFETPRTEGQPWRLTMEGRVPGTETSACLKQGGRTLEIRPPELLRYTFAWDERASVGLGASPYKENIVTVRFEDRGNKTVVHFHQAPFATESERDGHNGGWNSSLDKFAEFLASAQPERPLGVDETSSELHLRRSFRASRQQMFDAWTQPERVAQWWGPACFTSKVHAWEARQGGAIRVDMVSPEGTVFPMAGTFVEVYAPYRFHFKASALDAQGKALFENWNSVFLEEGGDETTAVLDVHVMSLTAEAAPYLKGMHQGWTQSLDRLAAMFEQQRPTN